MTDYIVQRAESGIGGFIVIIIWAAIALISYLVKRNQAPEDEEWEEEAWTPPPEQQQQSRPKPSPPPASRRYEPEPQRTQPARPSGTQQARDVIQQAIQRQQQQAAKPPPPLPGIEQQSLSSLTPDSIAMPSIKSIPTAVPSVLRRRKGAKIKIRGAKGWRQAIILSEVLERPRAFDT